MKKIIFVIAAIATLALTACSGCGSKVEPVVVNDSLTALKNGKLDVDHAIALDRQSMFAKVDSGNYCWYETQITFTDFLDSENPGEIEKIVDVFQVIDQRGGGSYDVTVWYFTHTINGTAITSDTGFWLEDMPLNNEAIKVPFKDAFGRMMAANYPKPHSRHCVLRKEVGPKIANPQYIFGNIKYQLYVDAVTGAVSDKSPSFNVGGFGKPLGEWP